jgi:predicted ATP-dependent protease
MALALLSELAELPISPSIVATGTVGVKLDIGPVGGLGGFGTQTGKVVGILKSRRVRITDLVLPAANFESATDEMRVLTDEGISIHAIRSVRECARVVFGVDENDLVGKIKERFEPAMQPTQTI